MGGGLQAVVPGRRPRVIQMDVVNALRDQFAQLPRKAKTTFTSREAIAILYEDIQSVLQKGYDTREITELINLKNWQISEGSLRGLLRDIQLEKLRDKGGHGHKKPDPASNQKHYSVEADGDTKCEEDLKEIRNMGPATLPDRESEKDVLDVKKEHHPPGEAISRDTAATLVVKPKKDTHFVLEPDSAEI